ncbi:unnamed protein product [Cunninghamella echinulata]
MPMEEKFEDCPNYCSQSTFACTMEELYQYSATNSLMPVYYSSSSSSSSSTDMVSYMESTSIPTDPFISISPIHDVAAFHQPITTITTTVAAPSTIKKSRAKDSGKKKCTNCGATKTPSWRRSIEGSKLLCNACGLYEKVNGRRRLVYIQRDGSAKVARGNHHYRTQQVCTNCGTTDPKCWQNYKKDLQCDICTQNPVQYDIVHNFH